MTDPRRKVLEELYWAGADEIDYRGRLDEKVDKALAELDKIEKSERKCPHRNTCVHPKSHCFECKLKLATKDK